MTFSFSVPTPTSLHKTVELLWLPPGPQPQGSSLCQNQGSEWSLGAWKSVQVQLLVF